MRTKLLLLIILPLMLIECQTSIWTMITRKDSKLFTASELLIIADTTSAIGFQYGFDPDLEMDYVYRSGTGITTDKDFTAKSPEMKKALLKYKTDEIITFFEKIIELKEAQLWKLNLYRERKKWPNATYLQKYVLPDTNLYFDILEKNVLETVPEYSEKISQRKEEIKMALSARLREELEKKEKEYPD